MSKNKQTIHYCTILSDEQWIFLLEGKSSTLRQKCLHRLMTDAVRAKTSYKIKGIDIVLEVGQVAASDVELAVWLGCNRKTVGKLIDCFNRLGMLTTRTNNRTSIHTLHFLTGWYVGGILITNPHYVRPSATAKGQPGDMRTSLSDDLPMQSVQNTIPGDSQNEVRDADSTGSGTGSPSSSLRSPATSDRAVGDEVDNPHSEDRQPDENPTEIPKETQDGTIGGETDPNIGKRN